jgi:hypothetical protein
VSLSGGAALLFLWIDGTDAAAESDCDGAGRWSRKKS